MKIRDKDFEDLYNILQWCGLIKIFKGCYSFLKICTPRQEVSKGVEMSTIAKESTKNPMQEGGGNEEIRDEGCDLENGSHKKNILGGSCYEGNFSEGKRQGYFIFSGQDLKQDFVDIGRNEENKYKWKVHFYVGGGDFVEDKLNGEGKIKYYDFDSKKTGEDSYEYLGGYEGEFKDGKYHGKGDLELCGKVKYEGHWENGEF